MRNRVVTVFGGSGFIGRRVVQLLAEQGATLRIATRRPENAIHLKPMGAVGQIVLTPWRANDDTSIRALVDGADYVVNLVGILYERRAGDFERVQGELPGRIGAAAAAAGVKRVSQNSAIGADAESSSLYARSKAEGEKRLRAAFPEAVILRPSIVFGPGDGFFVRFASMARLSPALPLIGGGKTRFQPVYVGDVAAAILAGLTREDAAGQTYELGGPRVYSFKELLEYMLHVLNRRRYLVNLPFSLAAKQAKLMELLPVPPLTRDQVELLKHDNVVAPGAKTLRDLGIEPTPLEAIVPDYLRPYQRLGFRVPAA